MTRSLQALVVEPGSFEVAPLIAGGRQWKRLHSFLFDENRHEGALLASAGTRNSAELVLGCPHTLRAREPGGMRASFEFVDGLGVGADDAPISSDPPDSLARTATLAARWITRLGGQSKDLSRWTVDADGAQADAQDGTSLLQLDATRKHPYRLPQPHSALTSTNFGSEGWAC